MMKRLESHADRRQSSSGRAKRLRGGGLSTLRPFGARPEDQPQPMACAVAESCAAPQLRVGARKRLPLQAIDAGFAVTIKSHAGSIQVVSQGVVLWFREAIVPESRRILLCAFCCFWPLSQPRWPPRHSRRSGAWVIPRAISGSQRLPPTATGTFIFFIPSRSEERR